MKNYEINFKLPKECHNDFVNHTGNHWFNTIPILTRHRSSDPVFEHYTFVADNEEDMQYFLGKILVKYTIALS